NPLPGHPPREGRRLSQLPTGQPSSHLQEAGHVGTGDLKRARPGSPPPPESVPRSESLLLGGRLDILSRPTFRDELAQLVLRDRGSVLFPGFPRPPRDESSSSRTLPALTCRALR